MTSNRPYLIRAIWEWISDNGLTPHLLVDAEQEGVEVPRQFVDDGRIVLNISANAVRDLELGNEFIAFSARFAGTAMEVRVPVAAVLGLYARENGEGMLFPQEAGERPPPEEDPEPPRPGPGRPTLKVIK